MLLRLRMFEHFVEGIERRGRRRPPAGERKLYFLIESDSDANVRAARKELKRSLDEHAALGAPAEADRYAKYKI